MQSVRYSHSIKRIISNEWLTLLVLCIGILALSVEPRTSLMLLLLWPILIYKNSYRLFIDKSFNLLLLFSASYALFAFLSGRLSGLFVVLFLVCPCLFFQLGNYFARKYSGYFQLLFFLLLIIVLPALYSCWMTVVDALSTGFINYDRHLYIMDEEDSLAITLIGTQVSLTLVGLSIWLVPVQSRPERRIKKILLLFGLLGVFTVVHFLNRTGLVITLLCIVAVMFRLIKYIPRKKFITLFVSFVIIVFLFRFFLASSDSLDSILSAYQSREIEGSNILNAGGRVERWLYGITNLFAYPYGGLTKPDGSIFYAHNLWLDVAKAAGLVPFCALLILTFFFLKRAWKLIVSRNLPIMLSCLLLVINISFFFSFFTEPVAEGVPGCLFLYFLFLGVENQLFKKVCSK